ncbi:hypothetical protein PDESU_01084 [Pontiella desulfatans]|uniref:Uncharacterized protein n=1 Tax=Pontiella desulfatans TaxID=2750659 RepID=A0A6C2TYV2_PONDE|nr:hypothetical protein [Pontiella desulfatans]VGO12531.1 hypothetical protein PDESU_01084 [Pontiella desulfatans]
MRNMSGIGVVAVSMLVGSSFAEVIYSQPFYNSATDKPLSEFGWSALVHGVDGVEENPAYTNKVIEGVGRSAGATDEGAVDATTPVGATENGYTFFAPKQDFAAYTNAVAILYTTISTEITVSELTKLRVDQKNDNADSVIRFAIRIGSQWYASAEDFGGENATSYAVKEMVEADFSDETKWLELTVATGAAGEITVGSAPVSALSGTINAYGLYVDAGTAPGGAGDHMRLDNFQVHDGAAPPTYDVLYSQPFYLDAGSPLPLTEWGWTSLVFSASGVVENPIYAGNEVEAISSGVAAGDMGAVNAIFPTNVTAGTRGYGFFAPKQDAAYAGATALMYTTLPTNTTVSGLQKLSVEQKNDNADSIIRFAIRIGSQWYASADEFGGQNAAYALKEMLEADFSHPAKWVELTVVLGGAGEISLGTTPASALSGIIDAYGIYVDSGTTPGGEGDHIRFDNFQVYGSANTVPPGGTEPFIVSYGMSGGISSLSFTGGVSEAYIILSSSALGSGFSSTVTPVSVSIGGLAGNVVTTDGAGDATAEFNSAGNVEFYMVESAQ